MPLDCLSRATVQKLCFKVTEGFMNTPDEKMIKDSCLQSNSLHG